MTFDSTATGAHVTTPSGRVITIPDGTELVFGRGPDADIVVSKLDRKVTVRPEMLDLDFTLFDGQEFLGWPEMTIQRGQVLARDGKLLAKEGQGRYIPAG